MSGVPKDGINRTMLNEPTKVHDTDPITHIVHDAQVVRYKDQGEPILFLQILQQVEDLRTNRDIQTRYCLVRDDDFWVDSERSSDTHSLALTTGQLPRISWRNRSREAYLSQEAITGAFHIALGHEAVHDHRLGDRIADCLPWIQRRLRVLEDHLDACPAIPQ
jgi:hypothetical protein